MLEEAKAPHGLKRTLRWLKRGRCIQHLAGRHVGLMMLVDRKYTFAQHVSCGDDEEE